jgi:hypothetical protein
VPNLHALTLGEAETHLGLEIPLHPNGDVELAGQ